MEIEFEGTVLEVEKIEYDIVHDPVDIDLGLKDDVHHFENRIVFKNLKPGDTYIGKRNSGWQMSTVADGRLWEYVQRFGYIYGAGMNTIYPYDISECRKVVKIDGEVV